MEYTAFVNRLNARLDELKWLYCELYRNDVRAFEYFVDMLRRSYDDRKQALRDQDERRLADPDWYRSNKMLGMMLYVDNFAGDLKGVRLKEAAKVGITAGASTPKTIIEEVLQYVRTGSVV